MIKITADRRRGSPAREVVWTTQRPVPRKAAPEDIMSKGDTVSLNCSNGKQYFRHRSAFSLWDQDKDLQLKCKSVSIVKILNENQQILEIFIKVT